MDKVNLTWKTRESDKEQSSLDVSDVSSVCVAHMPRLQLFYHSHYRCVLTQHVDDAVRVETNSDAADSLRQLRRERAASASSSGSSPSSSSRGGEDKGFFNRGLSAMLGRRKPGQAEEATAEKHPLVQSSSADENDCAGDCIAVAVTRRDGRELLVQGSGSEAPDRKSVV
jgi:hypothetical protein